MVYVFICAFCWPIYNFQLLNSQCVQAVEGCWRTRREPTATTCQFYRENGDGFRDLAASNTAPVFLYSNWKVSRKPFNVYFKENCFVFISVQDIDWFCCANTDLNSLFPLCWLTVMNGEILSCLLVTSQLLTFREKWHSCNYFISASNQSLTSTLNLIKFPLLTPIDTFHIIVGGVALPILIDAASHLCSTQWDYEKTRAQLQRKSIWYSRRFWKSAAVKQDMHGCLYKPEYIGVWTGAKWSCRCTSRLAIETKVMPMCCREYQQCQFLVVECVEEVKCHFTS